MFVGRYFLHKDPTKYGSGNPGTANMGAVFGKKAGILTCVGDL
ncbi:glycerol-3-phosphate acyltransferase, partial [Lactobacillus nasalidis]